MIASLFSPERPMDGWMVVGLELYFLRGDCEASPKIGGGGKRGREST